MRLQNKLAVITAAGSGMGRAGVQRFVAEGAHVAAIDINREALDHLVAQVGRENVVPIQADLSNPDEIRESINDAAKRLGGIDILWAHAGTPGPAMVEDLDFAAYKRAIDLNITSAMLGAGEAPRHMRPRGGGSIVFTSSVSGLVGSMLSPVYSACKFAVVGLAKSLAQRLAPDNIRVNVICPGVSDTAMLPEFLGRDGASVDEREATREKLLAAVPLGRLGRAEEMAAAALWLASDETSFVTGVALPVDGGYTCR
jgi:NAD(P)-dependent dehydrogenase (short-subunit alcohol dehydrogenase family)